MSKLLVGIIILISVSSFGNDCRQNLRGAYECLAEGADNGAFVQVIKDLGLNSVYLREGNRPASIYHLNAGPKTWSTTCTNSRELMIAREVDNSNTPEPFLVRLNNKEFEIGSIQRITSKYSLLSNNHLQITVEFDGRVAGTFNCSKL